MEGPLYRQGASHRESHRVLAGIIFLEVCKRWSLGKNDVQEMNLLLSNGGSPLLSKNY